MSRGAGESFKGHYYILSLRNVNSLYFLSSPRGWYRSARPGGGSADQKLPGHILSLAEKEKDGQFHRNTNFSTEQILSICLHLASTPMKSKSATLMHLLFVSSVRSSSVYHGLLEGSSSSTHFFKFFKFFRFESESESERTQHVLYF